MRIAIWHNLPSGGGKRALYYQARGLVERGHTVESWCPPTADQKYLPLNEFLVEHVIPISRPRRTGRNPVNSWLEEYFKVTDAIRAMDEHCRRCAEEINSGGFDILFAGACMAFRVTSIARSVNIPVAIYLGEPFRWLYEAMPRLPWLALPAPEQPWRHPRFIKAFLENLVSIQGLRVQAREEFLNVRAFRTILVNSLFSRESMLRTYGLDSQVCYLGIDTEKFRPLNVDKENYLVGVGAFVHEKNIRFVIEALARVRKPRPCLIWIGNVGDLQDELSEFAHSCGVIFTPRTGITDEELIAVLGSARAMVYAPRLEPFGLAPLEANACGLPVIAVAEGGVRETILDGVNGILVEHDPDAMAEAIERLANDAAYASDLGQNGRRLVVERWNLSSSIDRLERRLLATIGMKVESNTNLQVST